MKIQTTGGVLHAAAAWAAKLSPARPAVPIVGGAHLDTSSGELRISATDFDTFGAVTIPSTDATVLGDGEATVSARLLAAITKTLKPAAELTLQANGPRLDMQSGRSRWALPLLDTRDWPAFPELGDHLGTVPADQLHHELGRVLPAASTETARPHFNGVCATLGDRLTLVATDTYRMAAATVDWTPVDGAQPQQIIIPSDLLRTALAAIHDDHGDVAVHCNNGIVGLRSTRHQVMGRLIDAQWPDWRPIIEAPEKNTATVATVDVTELVDAVTAVAVMLGDQEALRLDLAEDGVTVSPAVGDQGEANTTVTWAQWSGAPITIGINHEWLRDALGCLDSRAAVLTLTGNPLRPMLFQAADDEGQPVGGYRHVIIPRRLTDTSKAAA